MKYLALMLLAVASVTANCFAQDEENGIAPPAVLYRPINLDSDTLRARLAPNALGLKPQAGSMAIELPFGINYNRYAKGLILPIDQKAEWGIGVGLNFNASNIVEISPSSSLGLQPKTAPGLMLHKKF